MEEQILNSEKIEELKSSSISSKAIVDPNLSPQNFQVEYQNGIVGIFTWQKPKNSASVEEYRIYYQVSSLSNPVLLGTTQKNLQLFEYLSQTPKDASNHQGLKYNSPYYFYVTSLIDNKEYISKKISIRTARALNKFYQKKPMNGIVKGYLNDNGVDIHSPRSCRADGIQEGFPAVVCPTYAIVSGTVFVSKTSQGKKITISLENQSFDYERTYYYTDEKDQFKTVIYRQSKLRITKIYYNHLAKINEQIKNGGKITAGTKIADDVLKINDVYHCHLGFIYEKSSNGGSINIPLTIYRPFSQYTKNWGDQSLPYDDTCRILGYTFNMQLKP